MSTRGRFEIHYDGTRVDPEEAMEVAQRIREAVSEPIDVRFQGKFINDKPTGFSFSVSIHAETRSNIEALLRDGFTLADYNEWEIP